MKLGASKPETCFYNYATSALYLFSDKAETNLTITGILSSDLKEEVFMCVLKGHT